MKKLVSLLLAVIMVISAFVVMPVSAGAADTNTVYLINSANWSDVHAYAWNNSVFGENAPWPGQAMQSAGTHSSGAQMYSITFPSAYENIIFNGGGNQTKDLSYQGGMGYDNGSGQWVAVDGPNPGPTPGPTPTPTPGGQMTVYFQNNWMWTDVKVYYWGSSSTNSSEWPGDTPQLAGNDGVYDVYSVTVPTDVVGVIFNGFDGGNGGNNQTPDIKGAADGDCYSMLWNESQGANDIKKDHISNVLPNIGPVTPTDPVPTQPVPTQPVPTQPVPTEPVPTEPVEDIDPNKAYVLVDDNYYEVTKGQTFTYNYTISVDSAKKIGSLDARTEYDEAGLKFVPEVDEYGDIDTTNTFPKLSNVVSNLESGSPLLYNYSNTTGVRMGADTVIFSGKFEVTASKGVFEISSKMKTLADADLNNLVYDFETVGQFSDAEVLPGLTPYNPSNPVNPTTPVPTQPVPTQPVPTQPVPTQPVPTEPVPTQPVPTTPVPTQPVVADKVYVKVDGVQYEVKKGDVFTYVFNFACSEKVSAMDVETLYNGDGLQFVPTVDSYGDDNLKAMFPVLQNVVYNFNLEDKLIYNYSSASSVRFPVSANGAYTDSNKVFVGKFKVTADSGVYEISSRIKVLGDGNAEKIIMNYEQINTSVTISQKNEIVGGTVVDPTTPVPTQPVVNPTTPTPTQPVVNPTTPTPTQPVPTEPVEDIDPNKAYVLVDGNYYEVTKGQTFTYNYTISVDRAKKIGSLDARTEYDQAGLKFIPEVDEFGDYVLDAMFPVVKNVVCNLEKSPLLYNHSSTTGVRMGENTVVFSGKFEVTASKGVFTIDSKMKTLADTDLNSLVFDFETVGQFSDAEVLPGLTPYNPSNPVNPTTPVPTQPVPTQPVPTQPVVNPTTPTPTQPVVNPTTPSGDIDPNKVYVKMDGDYYEVKKGDKVTYNYTISVDGTKKIASLDAYTTYDTKGLKFLPVMDEGEVVATAHFPKITTAVYNFGTAGKIMYNYSSTSGVRMANNSVVFSGEFEVTASKGVYEINSTMITLADTDFNKIVYKSEKVGDYDYDQLLVGLTPVKPSVDPTTPTTPTPTTPVTEKTYVIADGVKYEVAKGQEITYIYYMSYDKKIGSADVNVLYDAEGLEYINMVDEFGDDDLKTMFPVFKDVVYNGSQKGLILYNYSNTSGVRLPVPADGKMTEKNIAFIGKFKVVGGPGTYEINSKIKTLADADLDVLYFDFNKIEGKNVGIETELQVPELPTIPTEPEDDILYGDVDGNGKVNIFDASYVQKSIAGYDGYELDERAFEAADVDFNGKINVFDASRIQKFIAGYFDSFK